MTPWLGVQEASMFTSTLLPPPRPPRFLLGQRSAHARPRRPGAAEPGPLPPCQREPHIHLAARPHGNRGWEDGIEAGRRTPPASCGPSCRSLRSLTPTGRACPWSHSGRGQGGVAPGDLAFVYLLAATGRCGARGSVSQARLPERPGAAGRVSLGLTAAAEPGGVSPGAERPPLAPAAPPSRSSCARRGPAVTHT